MIAWVSNLILFECRLLIHDGSIQNPIDDPTLEWSICSPWSTHINGESVAMIGTVIYPFDNVNMSPTLHVTWWPMTHFLLLILSPVSPIYCNRRVIFLILMKSVQLFTFKLYDLGIASPSHGGRVLNFCFCNMQNKGLSY